MGLLKICDGSLLLVIRLGKGSLVDLSSLGGLLLSCGVCWWVSLPRRRVCVLEHACGLVLELSGSLA